MCINFLFKNLKIEDGNGVVQTHNTEQNSFRDHQIQISSEELENQENIKALEINDFECIINKN